jgi:hypothetical protein
MSYDRPHFGTPHLSKMIFGQEISLHLPILKLLKTHYIYLTAKSTKFLFFKNMQALVDLRYFKVNEQRGFTCFD